MIARWWVRKACHGQWWICCQYTDKPTCNSSGETHLVARAVRWWEGWRGRR